MDCKSQNTAVYCYSDFLVKLAISATFGTFFNGQILKARPRLVRMLNFKVQKTCRLQQRGL